MRQRVVYFAMILAAVTSVSAQEAKKWTLDDCIDSVSYTHLTLPTICSV